MKFNKPELQVILYSLENGNFPGNVSEIVTSARSKVQEVLNQFDDETDESRQED